MTIQRVAFTVTISILPEQMRRHGELMAISHALHDLNSLLAENFPSADASVELATDTKLPRYGQARARFMAYMNLDVRNNYEIEVKQLQQAMMRAFNREIAHKNPTIAMADTKYQMPNKPRSDRERIALLVYVDLDPAPEAFITKDSVVEAVHHMLETRISHYNPEVTLAPDPLQPNNREGNN